MPIAQVQEQLAKLAEDNSELRRMYTHLANQVAVASEELSCERFQPYRDLLIPYLRAITGPGDSSGGLVGGYNFERSQP